MSDKKTKDASSPSTPGEEPLAASDTTTPQSSGEYLIEPTAGQTPVADEEPSAKGPSSADKEPLADKEPSADKKPSADEEPSADKKPTADKGPSTDKPISPSKHASSKGAPAKNKSRSVAAWFFVLVLLCVIGALAYGAYYGNEWLKASQAETKAQLEQLELQQQSQHQALNALSGQFPQYAKADAALKNQLQKTEQRLAAAEQRLAVQNKRLLSISTTSRDDWLLAEAEYLLKLANQRILVERSAAGADALLSEADSILRDLGDPDLFPLRQAIAKDLAQVRLVDKIDLEGMYLQLQALANSVDSLPVRPTWDQLAETGTVEPLIDVELEGEPNTETSNLEAAEPSTQEANGWTSKIWQQSKHSFVTFTDKLGDYIRVRHHDAAVQPMLTPEANIYVQQNLRLILERAQLALLREQKDIYVDSLQQAKLWLKKYYPATQMREAFVKQLVELESKPVVQSLPDISGSLELLHTYIAELHQLKGVDAKAGDTQ